MHGGKTEEQRCPVVPLLFTTNGAPVESCRAVGIYGSRSWRTASASSGRRLSGAFVAIAGDTSVPVATDGGLDAGRTR